MVLHFSCEQYDEPFRAKRLGNWQIPRSFRRWPKTREGFTQACANDDGHILPGVKRVGKCPWGDFVGTWDLPCHLPGSRAHEAMARSKTSHERLLRNKSDAEYILSGKEKALRCRRLEANMEIPECYPEMMKKKQPLPNLESNGEVVNLIRDVKDRKASPPIHPYQAEKQLQEALKPLSVSPNRMIGRPQPCCGICDAGQGCITCGCNLGSEVRSEMNPQQPYAQLRPAGINMNPDRVKTPVLDEMMMPPPDVTCCPACKQGGSCITCGCSGDMVKQVKIRSPEFRGAIAPSRNM